MKAAEFIVKLGIFFILIPCAMIANNIYANDLGVMGETYTIIEIDFLEFIQSRVAMMQKNGQWQALQNKAQEEASYYRDRPKKVDGITRADKTKSWTFDPSIVLQNDISTPDGKLIAAAGTRVDPLIYISLSKALIFYNGDDQTQVRWALEQDKKLNGRDKLILVNGSVLDQEKHFKQTIYFDQTGTLTTRFGITHVPAIVTQNGINLKITEEAI